MKRVVCQHYKTIDRVCQELASLICQKGALTLAAVFERMRCKDKTTILNSILRKQCIALFHCWGIVKYYSYQEKYFLNQIYSLKLQLGNVTKM